MDGSVIVPLYVYPSVGAWDPVYDMASSYPRVQFTAIVNVHNGPGEGALPSAEYAHAIGTLNSLNNVRTIGYVATTWCTRNLSSVLDDIGAYSFWGDYNQSLAVNGIFVDETPTQYTPDYVSYLQTISYAIHDSPGLRDDYIVHNPGALPDPRYFDHDTSGEAGPTNADLRVVFENSFINWTIQGPALAEATQTYDRTKLALFLHSVPDMSTNETEITLQQLLAVGHSIWLTGTQDYTDFDAVLPIFIDCLAALLG
ncbi:Nn.00g071010.m01.CDS01 [Neocucurbitaria sp. VM-36]